jgi:hypothetical protein
MAWDSSAVLLRASLRTLVHSQAFPRLTGAFFFLTLLALACNGTFFAKPAEGQALEDSSVASTETRLVRPASDLERQVSSPSPTASPAPTTSVVPTAVPTVNPHASPPNPDPLRPSWVVNDGETGLWSAPRDGTLFSKVPAGATFRVLDRQDGRLRVFYPGDRAKRQPGEAWVDVADLKSVPWPRWVRVRDSVNILNSPGPDGVPIGQLTRGTFVEVVGESRGNWSLVYFSGEGRGQSIEGWLEVGPTVPVPGSEAISTFAVARDLLSSGSPETWLKVPYRSQLDGSAYAEANCGPTSVNMVLEGFGINVPQTAIRKEILSLQPNEDCDDCGVYIQNMAEVINRRGLTVRGLRDDKPEDFHHWTLDEIRAELRAGRPVIPQVFYRGLPARATSPYWGDHFIVVTGILGDRFIFNDPIDAEGPGYGRVITAQALDQAMAQSDYPHAAFSVGKS